MDRSLIQEMRDMDVALEGFKASDLARARRRLATEPDSLSRYEQDLLGDEWHQHVKAQREEEQRSAKKQEAHEAIVSVLRPAGITFRCAELEQLNAHAIALASLFSVKCCRSDKASGSAAERRVNTPAITNHERYGVFLHELAHAIAPMADGRQHRYTATKEQRVSPGSECAAWEFALGHAKVWTADMHNAAAFGLISYAPFATPFERDQMVAVVKKSAAKVSDRPLDQAKVTAQCDAVLSGEVTNTMQDQASSALVTALQGELTTLREEVKTIASRPEVAYCGVHVDGQQYSAGSLVTRQGSLWCATASTTATPGTAASGWQLIVKQGRA